MAIALVSSVVVGFPDRSDALDDAHDEEHVAGFFADLVSSVVPVDIEIGDCAAGLRARSKALAIPDALIAATAEINGEVELLLSGDGDVAKAKGLTCPVRLIGSGRT